MNGILLIENECATASADASAFAQLECTVVRASTTADASAACTAVDPAIELILIDIEYGSSSTGDSIETAALLQRVHSIPVMFLYAQDDPSLLERTTTVESYGCVKRNSGPTAFAVAIRTALKLHREHRDHYRTELALEKSERLLRFALNGSNEGIWDVVLATGEVYINPRGCEILGYAPDGGNDLAKVWMELVHPEDMPATTEQLTAHLDGTLPFFEIEQRLRMKSGEWKWVLTRGRVAVRDENGAPIRMTGTHTDITKRKRIEDALRESERQHRDLIEKMPDGVYKSTHEGRFLEINPAMVKILGYASKEELLAIDIKSELYFAATERESAALEEKLEEMAIFRLRKKDGTEVWVEDHGQHVVDEHGAVLYHEGILRDVTERVLSDRQMLQAQKLEGIGTLAGGIAHDFNNLLAMILGAAELLGRQTADSPQLKKYVDRIIEASQRGASISRQLLLFSRPNEAEMKPVSLSGIITELQEMLKHFLPKSIAINISLDADDGMIMGDAGQLHQALLNLALNASDAMEGRGVMTIRESRVEADVLRTKYAAQDMMPYIAVSVTDTGAGMSPETIAKIFEPFFSTKERGKGTGLGLSIVHGIVKTHRGFIDVESAPCKGTTFTLFFPASSQSAGSDVRELIRPPDHAGKTILLVDDEQLIREMLVEFLEESGYTVMPAVNGADALRLYEKYHHLIDLVITDLGMPELGGEELYRRLKTLDRNVKVIVSSGYLDGSTKADLMTLGVKDVLTKPYKFDQIRHVIQDVLCS